MVNQAVGDEPKQAEWNSADALKPPPFTRQFRVARLQLIGIPLLALLPLLALFGALDRVTATVGVESDDLALQVEYVARDRFRMQDEIKVAVTRLSQGSPTTITVAFERDYLEHFSELNFLPSVDAVSEQAYIVRLQDVARGETRVVRLEMRSAHYWTKRGIVSAAMAEGEPISVTVSTTIFP